MEQQKARVLNTIIEIIVRCLDGEITPAEIKPETSLVDDLDLDSATMVDVVLDLEDRFKIKITASESRAAFTVGDLESLVLRKQELAQQSA